VRDFVGDSTITSVRPVAMSADLPGIRTYALRAGYRAPL
jgi:hypothetical protein